MAFTVGMSRHAGNLEGRASPKEGVFLLSKAVHPPQNLAQGPEVMDSLQEDGSRWLK